MPSLDWIHRHSLVTVTAQVPADTSQMDGDPGFRPHPPPLNGSVGR